MSKENVLAEIGRERIYQDKKWGTDADDKYNGPMQWTGYITYYATSWFAGGYPPYNKEAFRTAMVKVAALAVAAIEQIDRKGTDVVDLRTLGGDAT